MALPPRFQQTIVKVQPLLDETGNVFRAVSSRPYRDKKGKLPDGVTLTLTIIKDASGRPPEESLLYENFEATILCGSDPGIKKGDFVSLQGFREDVSYYINFSYILRFDGVQKVAKPGGGTNATDK